MSIEEVTAGASAPAPGVVVPERRALRPWLVAAKVIVSCALLVWIVRTTDVREVLTAMRGAALPLLLAAFALNFVGYTISIARWKLLLAAQGTRAGIPYLLQSYVVAIFFNNLLPSTIGGDTIRAYDTWRLTGSRSQALAVIFTDRFLGVLALVVFAVVAVFLGHDLTAGMPLLRTWLVVGSIGLLLGSWALLFVPARLASWLEGLSLPGVGIATRLARKASDAFAAFRGRPRSLVFGFALSLLLQMNVVVHYFLIGSALDLAVPLSTFFLIVPLSLAIMAMPISINGIGVRESAFAFFFAFHGVGITEAVAFAWLSYGLSVVQALAGGVVYALRR